MSRPATAPVIVLVVALAAERRALQGAIRDPQPLRLEERIAFLGRVDGREVLLVQSGIGRAAAHAAAIAATRSRSVEAVWSLGFAGGLVDSLRTGDLVCPAVLLDDTDPSGGPFPADPSHAAIAAALRRSGLPIHAGPIVSVAAPLRTPDAKRRAHHACGAVAVEMEAAGVARAAKELGIPFLALKVIVDGVEEVLPAALAGCVTPEGNLDWTGLLAGSLRGPRFWRSLCRLGKASRLARRSLRQGLEAAFGASAALTPS